MCQYQKKDRELQTGITHIACSDNKAGSELLSGLDGGSNCLKNISTCKMNFNQYVSITEKTERVKRGKKWFN